MTLTYREDIDWLRAIAVLSVLGFHWEVSAFPGGYTGVDIFFVISGFLITGIIQKEMAAGTFTFARFYERRVRRLLPALYVMVALVTIPAFYFLLPSERFEFFKSAAATVTFVSNIFFWQQAGYFARPSIDKPLLHTWSLSVEEQFYLVLPLMIWALLRWQRGKLDSRLPLFIGTSVVALVSFLFGVWLLRNGNFATAFFMSPSRAWEFLLGSLIALPGVPVIRNVHVFRIMRGLGLGLIATAVFAYRHVNFPGVAALVPCAGAALFIWSGNGSGAPMRGRYSPLRVLSFFGLISYSLYLWHWPIFVYTRFSMFDLVILPVEKLVLFPVVVGISYLSYRFVELPVRRREFVSTMRGAFAGAAIASAVLLLGSLAGAVSFARVTAPSDDVAKLESYTSYFAPFENDKCFVHDWSSFDRTKCLDIGAGKIKALLFGDSLAAQYYHGLNTVTDSQRVAVLEATTESCMPSLVELGWANTSCNSMTRFIEPYLRDHKPDIIILSADWLGYNRRMGFGGMLTEVNRLLTELKSRGIPVVFIGPTIQFRGGLPWILLRLKARNLDTMSAEKFIVPEIFALDRSMKDALSGQAGVTYLSLLDEFCPNRNCTVVVGDGAPLTFDHAHLTTDGAIFIAPYIAKAAGLPLAVPAK